MINVKTQKKSFAVFIMQVILCALEIFKSAVNVFVLINYFLREAQQNKNIDKNFFVRMRWNLYVMWNMPAYCMNHFFMYLIHKWKKEMVSFSSNEAYYSICQLFYNLVANMYNRIESNNLINMYPKVVVWCIYLKWCRQTSVMKVKMC